MGVGVVVGVGIFVLTGTAAAQFAGPAIVISFIIGGAACALTGLCYAELASVIPASGGAYSYARATLGIFPAWFLGWNLILEYLFGASYVAIGWSGYLVGLLESSGMAVPHYLAAAPVDSRDGVFYLTGSLINLPAVALALGVMLVALLGIKLSSTVNAVIVSLKLAVLLAFVIAGAFYVTADNLDPFIPANRGDYGEFGMSGVLRGAAVVFVAYLGFDAVATAGREARDPQRTMPIAILGSLAVCTLVYCGVALVLVGLAPYGSLNVSNPLSVGLRTVGGGLDWLAPLVDMAAIIGLSSVLLVIYLALPRIMLAISRDGLLPRALGKVNERTGAPSSGTIVIGLAVAILSGLFPITMLSQLVSLGTLLIFAGVCASVLALRKLRPDLPRPFRVPAVHVIAPAGIAVSLYLLAGLTLLSWKLYLGWSAIGLLIYFFYARRARETGSAA
jgi:APA family basic amino acid/polyamine antiporter